MAVAVEALSPAAPASASVPVDWFLDWVETDPLTLPEDRAWFRDLLADETTSRPTRPA